MKRKSKLGLFLGILGLLLGLPIGAYSFVIVGIILALTGHVLIAHSIYLFYAAGIVAFISLIVYFIDAKVGGILLLFTILLYVTPFICGVYALLSNDGSLLELIPSLIVGNIPTIFLLSSAILGSKAKPKTQINKEQ